jgi:alpha-galactosidase
MDSDEGEGREGINESKYVEAHYRLWDDIIKITLSIGGCGFVDSCASGGGRNDIESMRRAVPILRSDADRTTTSMRLSMSASFNKWLPFSGAFASEKALDKDMLGATDVYVSRASYLPILNIAGKFYFAEQREIDEKLFAIREWNEIKRFLTCDFYVHTPWHLPTDTTGFSAFSYFDSSADEGIILAFRREDCRESKLRIKLPYAKEAESVLLCDADTGEQSRYSDLEAAEKGITLSFDKPRSARLIKVKVNSK